LSNLLRAGRATIGYEFPQRARRHQKETGPGKGSPLRAVGIQSAFSGLSPKARYAGIDAARAFEDDGVEFVERTKTKGSGVRLKK
jgi:hypothetical protein